MLYLLQELKFTTIGTLTSFQVQINGDYHQSTYFCKEKISVLHQQKKLAHT